MSDRVTSTADDDQITFEIGSGNVFADLGFPEPEIELGKAEISRQIAREMKARGLTQGRAAALLGIDQPRVSLVVRGRTEEFSLERLLELLRRFNYSVDIRLTRSDTQSGSGLRVTVPA